MLPFVVANFSVCIMLLSVMALCTRTGEAISEYGASYIYYVD